MKHVLPDSRVLLAIAFGFALGAGVVLLAEIGIQDDGSDYCSVTVSPPSLISETETELAKCPRGIRPKGDGWKIVGGTKNMDVYQRPTSETRRPGRILTEDEKARLIDALKDRNH